MNSADQAMFGTFCCQAGGGRVECCSRPPLRKALATPEGVRLNLRLLLNPHMKHYDLKTRLHCTIALLTLAIHTNAQTAVPVLREKSEDVILLSPFTIGATRDVGYIATSTLAGTRIRTDLKDLGSAISVVTKEFLRDTAATNAGTLLSYTTNTEVGGYQGNFSGAVAGGTGRIEQTSERTNPQFNQRVRGLGRADLTRGYFLTDIAFDSYNTDQVTVSRGPNSILFGIGSPGGVINNSIKLPIHHTSFTEVSARFDSYGRARSRMSSKISSERKHHV